MTRAPSPQVASGPRRLAPATLEAEARRPLLNADGHLHEPVLFIDLDAEQGDLEAVVPLARTSDRILVGTSNRGVVSPEMLPLVRALDLTLVPASSPAQAEAVVQVPDTAASEVQLHTAVMRNPDASTALTHLLRWSGSLAVRDALDAESLCYSTLLGGPEFSRWLQNRGCRRPPPAPMTEPVLIRRAGRELWLTLNRVKRRNAYGREIRDALVSALLVAHWDTTVRRVVLEGAGPAFCSGGDLDEFGTAPDVVTAHWVRTRGGAAMALHLLRDRVEAHLHGACVGAGIELPAFASRVVAAPETRIRLPEIGMGLIPGAGGTVSLPRRIGRWRTLYLALTGEFLAAPTARAWGLVDDIIPDTPGPGRGRPHRSGAGPD